LRTGIKPHRFPPSPSVRGICARGRGTVRIKAPTPLAPPEIRFNFRASDYDFQALISGMRISRKIADSRDDAVASRGGAYRALRQRAKPI